MTDGVAVVVAVVDHTTSAARTGIDSTVLDVAASAAAAAAAAAAVASALPVVVA